MKQDFYRILDNPLVYALSQWLFAPGAQYFVKKHVRELLQDLPAGEPLLDLACGPQSFLNGSGLRPIGLDINPTYALSYAQHGREAVLGSGGQLPFRNESFLGVWSMGLFHHIPDKLAHDVFNETIRVCKPGGYVAILDAVLPHSSWSRPLAATIRALDRGEFMRREEKVKMLLPFLDNWKIERLTYAATGLEMLSFVFRK